MSRTLLSVAIVVLLSGSVLAGFASASGELDRPAATRMVKVFGHLDEVDAVLGIRPGADSFNAFFIAELDARQVRNLDARGIPYVFVDDFNLLKLERGSFDPLSPPVIPYGYQSPSDSKYFIVQAKGPWRETWSSSLQSSGSTIHAYLPENAYVVKVVDAYALGRVQNLDFVRATIPFHAWYRVDPALDVATGKIDIQVVTFERSAVDRIDARLAQLGAERITKSYTVGEYVKGSVGRVNVRVDAELIPTIAAFEDIEYVEPAEVFMLDNSVTKNIVQDHAAMATTIWTKGVDGTGVRLAATDTGVRTTHEAFQGPAKLLMHKCPVGCNQVDEMGHGTHVTGTIGGDPPTNANQGMARKAGLSHVDISNDAQQLAGSGDLHVIFDMVYADGARIVSNSWGAPVKGEYTGSSKEADQIMWERPDFLEFFSAGNNGTEGASTIGAPATGKNVMTIGATARAGGAQGMASFSSKGPTKDGRLKPTLTAPGDPLTSTCNTSDSAYCDMSGTSMSGPAAAGATGLIQAYFQQGFYPLGSATSANAYTPSGALMKAVALASTDDMTGPAAIPNNDEGWGRIDLINALRFAGDNKMLRLVDNKAGLATGSEVQYVLDVRAGQKLRVVLVWSDYPGALGAGKMLVNDLDLEVKAPGGTTYLGNVWSAGNSNTGGTPDTTNVEELVQLATPTAGAYTITVRGSNAPKGPQPFALVVNADLDPAAGLVLMDKAVYGDADTITIQVTDGSFTTAGQSTTVKVTSGTEPVGEMITLNGGFGLLSGTLMTTFAAPAADGKISVSHGDTVTVTYTDAAPAGISIAQAKIDATFPAIFDVTVKYITDRGASVFWNTTKPATSSVFYGTAPSLGQSKVDTGLSVVHQVDLGGLNANTLYYFDVEGTDPQNHRVRDTNGGSHYTFTTTPTNDILVIDGSDNTVPYMDTVIGDLQFHGWSVTTWYNWRDGPPPKALLQAYRAVLWETVERYPPMDDAHMSTLIDYNNQGGRLMASGHDIAWAFGDPTQNCYGTTLGCNFVKFQLKSQWKTDPLTWASQTGIASDPISGPWATRNIPYVPLRDGGAGDDIGPISAGGTTTPVWKNALANDIAMKWVSSANNGTAGVGVWGGTPSKVIFNAFEPFRLNKDTPKDVDRSGLMNSSIVWLLGRYHPITKITEPAAGGSYQGVVTIKWNAQAFGGMSIGKQDLFYSPDGGKSWALIVSPAPGTLQHSWNTVGLPNGNNYCLRMIVADSGAPALTGQSVHCSFVISNPGGDTIGPLVSPGSIITVPNPANQGDIFKITAVVDDSNKGGSIVSEVEFTIDGGVPTKMNASDGAFDAAREAVRFLGPHGATAGPHTLSMRGRDAAGNWGPTENATFSVNGVGVGPGTVMGTVKSGPTPIKGAKVTAKTANGSAGNAITDSVGEYVLVLAPGTYDLEATATGCPPKSNMGVQVQAGRVNQPQDFDLACTITPGSISGKVTSGVNPLAGATVKAMIGAGVIKTVTSDASGNYLLDALGPAAYDVECSLATYITKKLTGVVVTSGVVTPNQNCDLVKIGPGPTGSITGKVTDQNSAALPGATVTAVNGSQQYPATTDATGVYVITNLPGGPYTVDVVKSGCTSPGAKSTTVVPPSAATADFQMTCTGGPTTGNIKGKVTDQTGGAPISGATVYANQSGVNKKTATTITDGSYTLVGLDPGNYDLSVTAPGYLPKSGITSVVIAGQDTAQPDIQLTKPSQPGKGGVAGKVTETTSAAAVGAAKIRLLQGTTEVGTAMSAVDGSYTLTNIAPGSYTIEASKTDYETATKPVTVKAGENAAGDISIKKKDVTPPPPPPPPPPTDKGIFGMGSMVDFAIIGAIIAAVVVMLLVMLMMKKKKGSEVAYQPSPPGFPPGPPPQQQWGPPPQPGYDPNQQWQQPPPGGQGGGY